MPHKDPEANRKYHRERKRRLRRERGAKQKKVFSVGEKVPDSNLTYSGVTDPKEYTSVHKLKHLWTCGSSGFPCGNTIKQIQGEILRTDGKGIKSCGQHGCPYAALHRIRHLQDETVKKSIKPSRRKQYVKINESLKHKSFSRGGQAMRERFLSERRAAALEGKNKHYVYGKHVVTHMFFGKIYLFGRFDTPEEAIRVSQEVIDYYIQHHAVPFHLVAKVRQKLRIGDVIGHLTYLGPKPEREHSRAHPLSLWECDCGRKELFECSVNSVMSGNTSSCGCVRSGLLQEQWAQYREELIQIGEKVAGSRLTYRGLSNRKSNANKQYGLWDCDCGNKGVEILISAVCRGKGSSLWRMNAPKSSTEVPSAKPPVRSCGCLASEATAERNRQNAKFITYNGQTLSITQWAEQIGISQTGLAARLRRMSVDKALSPQNLRGNAWTKEEIAYLRSNFIPATRGNLDLLATALGRSKSAISTKTSELGLTQAKPR